MLNKTSHFSLTIALALIIFCTFGNAVELEISEHQGETFLKWNPDPGKQYYLLRSFDLHHWFSGGTFGSDSAEASFSGTSLFPRQFYRVEGSEHPLESLVTNFYSFDATDQDPRIPDLPSAGGNLLTESGFQTAEGKIGIAASFDASARQPWRAPTTSDFSSQGTSFSFSFWVK